MPADRGWARALDADQRILLNATQRPRQRARSTAAVSCRCTTCAGLVRLAPALDGVPGIPPLGAVGRAMHVVDAVGGLLGRSGAEPQTPDSRRSP